MGKNGIASSNRDVPFTSEANIGSVQRLPNTQRGIRQDGLIDVP